MTLLGFICGRQWASRWLMELERFHMTLHRIFLSKSSKLKLLRLFSPKMTIMVPAAVDHLLIYRGLTGSISQPDDRLWFRSSLVQGARAAAGKSRVDGRKLILCLQTELGGRCDRPDVWKLHFFFLPSQQTFLPSTSRRYVTFCYLLQSKKQELSISL